MGNSTQPYGHFAGVVGANQIRVPVVATTVCYNLSGTRLRATVVSDRPGDAKATPTVYDIDGRRVATAVDEALPTAGHEWTALALTPGVYVYKLNAGNFSAARKMVIID